MQGTKILLAFNSHDDSCDMKIESIGDGELQVAMWLKGTS